MLKKEQEDHGLPWWYFMKWSQWILRIVPLVMVVAFLQPVFFFNAHAEDSQLPPEDGSLGKEQVKSLTELQDALRMQTEWIVIADDIIITETLRIGYDCTIESNALYTLERGEGFDGALLELARGVRFRGRQLLLNGKDRKAKRSAVVLEEGSWASLQDCSIRNNCNMGTDGGGIYAEKAILELERCTLQGNHSEWDGGGIAINWNEDTMSADGIQVVTIHDSHILQNTAKGDGGGLAISAIDIGMNAHEASVYDTEVCSNESGASGGGVLWDGATLRVHGASSICHNRAEGSGGGLANNFGNLPPDAGLYLHDSTSVHDNRAKKEGGGVCAYESVFSLQDQASIHDNYGEYGGGVYFNAYEMYLQGGTIFNNLAKEFGGGLYLNKAASLHGVGIYDNRTQKVGDGAGDDIYAQSNLSHFEPASTQARYYGEGNSLAADSVAIESVGGYALPQANEVLVPYRGWYLDNREQRYDSKHFEWNTPASPDDLNGSRERYGLKQAWYGHVLIYDANVKQGETPHQYQYDSLAYEKGTLATVKPNPFSRSGYHFVGWNTREDGAGEWYVPEDENANRLVIQSSSILYAQWVKASGAVSIQNTVTGHGDRAKRFTFVLRLLDARGKPLSGTYAYQGNGVPDGSIKSGETIALAHGQSIRVGNLPLGSRYSVVEQEANLEGYTTTSVGAEGEVVEGGNQAIFTNDKEQGGSSGGDSSGGGGSSGGISGGGDSNGPTNPVTIQLCAELTFNHLPPRDPAYTVLLKNADGEVIQGKKNMGGEVRFDTISFHRAGTYTYTMFQQKDQVTCVTFDEEFYTILVQVQQIGDDLKATVSYEKNGKRYDGLPLFQNEMAPKLSELDGSHGGGDAGNDREGSIAARWNLRGGGQRGTTWLPSFWPTPLGLMG